MDEDVKSSFHGSLSRFAYVVPSASSTSFESSLSSCRRPSHSHSDLDTATAQPRNRIPISNVVDPHDARDGRANIATSSSLASKRKAGETTEKPRSRSASKRQNRWGILGRVAPGSDSCARLNGIPDHVAEDLDGASRPSPPPPALRFGRSGCNSISDASFFPPSVQCCFVGSSALVAIFFMKCVTLQL